MGQFDEIPEEELKAARRYTRTCGFFSLLILPLTFVYLEIILRVTSGDTFAFWPTVGMVMFSLGMGFLADLFCTVFRHRAARWVCFAIAEIATVLFLIMYFVNNAYRTYMDPASMLAGTGYVVGEFGSTLTGTIKRGIPKILLYHIPVFLWLYPMIRHYVVITHRGKWQPIFCTVLSLVMLVSSPFVMTAQKQYRDKFTEEYTFDSSVRTFGCGASLGLDTFYSIFGNPFVSIGFDVPDANVVITPTASAMSNDRPSPDAGTAGEEPPPVYGFNGLDIDYAALAGTAPNKTVADMFRYIASEEPSKQNEFTGLFEGKNLILITAEAFSAEVIDEERTPTLYRMATKGIKFDDYYQPAWGGSTSTGEFSVITGILPVNKVASVRQTIGHNMYMTIGSQLKRLGYETAAYHNGSYTYYGRNETHENFGYAKFIGMGNGMEKGVTDCWPESDDEMFRYIMPEFIEGGKPFSLYFMTVSGHCAYSVGGNSMSLKNYSTFSDMDASEPIKCYHAANYELEKAMTYLIGALEDAGIADDTVIVISADHYPYGLEDSAAWGTDKDYLAELYGYTANSNMKRDHNALIMWCGCLEDREEPVEITDPVYSLDIVPTLSNLFGVEYDSRLLTGRDVFSTTEPIVIWHDYSWKTDKGYYDSRSGVFTPNDGVAVENGYVDRIKGIVKNKYTFAKGLLDYDFYGIIFDEK